MEDKELDGRLVYLTVYVDNWLRKASPGFNVNMANRLAKVIKVFDWESEEGQLLLQARQKTGKWKDLKSEDFKFVLKVYHPDLIIKTKKGCMIEEVLPRYYPGTKYLLFDVFPDELLKDINKVEKDVLKLENKKTQEKISSVKRRAVRKKKTTNKR